MASRQRLFRIITAAIAAVAALAAANWAVQVARKPSEALFPLDSLVKMPAETWREYAPLFRAHATGSIPAELLAALAQVEGAGNPAARTYWRWRLDWNPIEIYRPASSAVGMYQITDARFAEAKRLCIRDHQPVHEGPWYDPRTCWFNAFYFRVLPSHAIEMTAAYLHLQVERFPKAKRHDLAAVVHLCGASAAQAFARRGFRPAPGERCGEHDLAAYLARVNALKREFARLAGA